MSAPEDNPQRLGDYELLTRLATGGMADIFLARQTGLGGLERVVVIKRIKPEHAADPSFTEMFLREARIVARINDPNVVRIFELGEEDGDYFISMEYIHGLAIADLITESIQRETWLPMDTSAAIVEQACQGLHQVHEVRDLDGERMGLIHRDVSHQNFLCTEEGFVKLIDFGIAKSTESEEEATHSGTLKGKYAYMSPEQCRREELDRRSDVFSLGIVAWELFAGKRLFKRPDKMSTIEAITTEEIPNPASQNSRLPAGLDRAVMRALEQDPSARYQTADAFRSAMLDAGHEAGLVVDHDRLGNYVRQVAGDRLEQRREELRRAVDAQSGDDGSGGLEMAGLESRAGAGKSRTEVWLERTGAVGPVLLFVAAALLLVGTGWYVLASPPGEPLQIGWTSTMDRAVVERETEPLWEHLGDELGRPVEIAYRANGDELASQLTDGRLDVAMLPAMTYVQASQKKSGLELVATRTLDDRPTTEGVVVVPEGSEIEAIEDLAGRRVCMTDRRAPAGNVFLRAHLGKLGYDPQSFFGPIQWSGTHERVLRDLRAGRCDAGASSAAAVTTAESSGEDGLQLRRVATTGELPLASMVAGSGASANLVAKLRGSLLEMSPRKVAGKSSIGDRLQISGFAHIGDGDYDELRETLEQIE